MDTLIFLLIIKKHLIISCYILITFYLIPTWLAIGINSKYKKEIFFVNITLGWTIFLWFIAIGLVFKKEENITEKEKTEVSDEEFK